MVATWQRRSWWLVAEATACHAAAATLAAVAVAATTAAAAVLLEVVVAPGGNVCRGGPFSAPLTNTNTNTNLGDCGLRRDLDGAFPHVDAVRDPIHDRYGHKEPRWLYRVQLSEPLNDHHLTLRADTDARVDSAASPERVPAHTTATWRAGRR